MTKYPEDAQLSPVKQALLEIRTLRGRLDEVERAKNEPIAIIGIGLRFPGGANNPAAFWQLLRDGVDATREMPTDRWDVDAFYDPDPDAPGKMYVRRGGFLWEDVHLFDPAFYGISPREAQSLDPKQRLLLEVSWEALENAGLIPDKLLGSQTGVFIGIGGAQDFGYSMAVAGATLDAYVGPGATYSAAAGRLSYFYGFKGPALSVDTACSSSLVAVHLACQSLRNQESNMALAAGVTVHLQPYSFINQTKLRMVSPDGRCKTFDASGDGVGRGEGCGIVVLKRLSDALADGDNILALIRGSAVNQDGRTSGLTAPNGPSQQEVIRRALSSSGVEPRQVSYLEAHGTGTPLGDPIEIQAAAAVYGKDRPADRPLLTGSVKTNIGHLEEGAGVASLIKVILALQNQELPPSLHFQEPNPFIPWERLPVKINAERTPWPSNGEQRLAGISSFGWSGTNAHVIVEEAPHVELASTADERSQHLLTLSARSETALRELAQRYEMYLGQQETNERAQFPDICFTANTRRTRFAHRLGVVAASSSEARKQLAAFVAGTTGPGIVSGVASGMDVPEIAFLFTGQGSQYMGMGRQLYDSQPVFRATLNQCDELLRPYLDRSLLSILYPEDGQSPINETAYTQPALFALEYSLAALWRSWGIEPAIMMGHSVGEYVAACIAGVFSLEDGLRLIAERGRLMQTLPTDGLMAAVFTNEERVNVVLAHYNGEVTIAAKNGPEIMVISGAKPHIEAIIDRLRTEEIRAWPLTVSHALHTASMDSILDTFETLANSITYAPPKIKMISLVTGQTAQGADIASASYWRRHMRETVRFSDAMINLYGLGYKLYLEIGPNPNLLGMGQLCVPEGEGVWIPSLRQNRGDWHQLLESVGMLYTQGVHINWADIEGEAAAARRQVQLPTYPFQRQHYWFEVGADDSPANRLKSALTDTPILHLLQQGETTALVHELERAVTFSDDEKEIVPKLLDVLVTQHQQQVQAAPLQQWLYEVIWKRQPHERMVEREKMDRQGDWLIFADRQGIGSALASRLRDKGHQCHVVYPSEDFQSTDTGEWQINPARGEDFEQLLQAIVNSERQMLGVVHLWSVDGIQPADVAASSLRRAQAFNSGSVLHLIQALARSDRLAVSPQLWLATKGAQPVGESSLTAIEQAPLWGLGNVIRAEHPELRCIQIDLDPAAGVDANSQAMMTEIEWSAGENGVAFRNNARYVSRLVRSKQLRPAATSQIKVMADATYLITGGMGGLGLLVARWLVEQGARHLVLMGRSAPSPETQSILSELETAGVQIVVERADVTQAEQVAQVFAHIEVFMPSLRGIIHAAGTLDDGVLLQQEWTRFASVMASKVEGTWNLHSLTLDKPLDFFVMFSSIAATLGSPGQSNYAAANAFLDAMAHYRRARGLPALSINWGFWSEVGMASQLGKQSNERWASIGINLIAPQQGLQILDRLLQHEKAQVIVLPVDWSKFMAQFISGLEPPFLAELVQELPQREQLKRPIAMQTELVRQLRTASRSKRQELLIAHVRQQTAKVMALDDSYTIDVDVPIRELGLDSLMAVQLRNALSVSLGYPLPATLLFNYPTVAALTDYLSRELMSGIEGTTQSNSASLSRDVGKGEPIAIVGMSGRFPGARNIDAFWELLRDGVDAITEVPQGRWNNAAYYDPDPETPGKTYTRWGGFIEDVDQFDPQFFGISPREAVAMDPQQRLLLETSWEALENAGLSASRLMGSQTGVFVGIGNYDYAQLQLKLGNPKQVSTYSGAGNALSMAAGRLSYVLGLHGPSLAVDTACSSSLVALHLACQSLSSGECDTALAGGVNLMLAPEVTVALSQAHMMAADGHCKTFDAAADGYVRGEGCGIVVLKRLSDAVADGDHILALIRGTAVNQDGRSQGLTAPNGLAQEAVINQAIARAGVDPREVHYLEAHGTGTSLGDPIEVGALAATYGAGRSSEEKLLVGSVKTNIGHLENAAGVAGLIKVVLSMQHELIPPHLHFQEPNPYIPWDELPIEVAAAAQPWPTGNGRRLAGLSSFGFSGTNAHVIIEEAPKLEPVAAEVERPVHLLTLSARSETALQELAHRYEARLTKETVNLADLCYTANSGRAHFSHRLAAVAETTRELGEKLAAFKEGREAVGLIKGKAPRVDAPKVAFLFTGQGSQYLGMGQELYQTQPTFRAALGQCDELLRPHLGRSILEVIFAEQEHTASGTGSAQTSLLDETGYTQPALFALEYALAQMWLSWGIQPAVVMGHSVGEYVAACVAGVFSLEDGLKLIAARGRLMQALPPGGVMVSLFTSQERVAAAIAPYSAEVSIAAINGPSNIVISGAEAAVRAVVEQLEQEGVTARALTVSHAFHSPLMEPILDEFEAVAASITYNSPELGLISNVSGQLVKGDDVCNPAYWREHVRRPVQFAQAITTMHEQGYEVFLEVGPHPTLLGMGQRVWTDGERIGTWLASLRKGRDTWSQILDSMGQMYVLGVEIDWLGFDRDYAPARRRLSLPSYPFQHQRFWFDSNGQGTQDTQGMPSDDSQLPIIGLLQQGDTEQLARELAEEGTLSESDMQLAPRFLDVLVRKYQQQVAANSLQDWLYELTWQPKPLVSKSILAEGLSMQPGIWLILADRAGIGQDLSQRLEALHQTCFQAYPETEQHDSGFSADNAWYLDPAKPVDFEQLFQKVFAREPDLPLRGIVHLWSLGAASSENLSSLALQEAQLLGSGSTLHLIQALVDLKLSVPPRLWLVTQSAMPVTAPTVSLEIAQAPLWGLGKAVALEHPELWGGLVDLASGASESQTNLLFTEVTDSDGEDHVAFRNDKRYVSRLVRSGQLAAPVKKPLRVDGTYLITGGLGSIGLRVARWLVKQGARHLVLTGRRADPGRAREVLQSLEEAGSQVVVAQADVTNEEAMSRVLEQIETTMPPLAGVIHAAGLVNVQAIKTIEYDAFAAILSAKVTGSWVLHQLTKQMDLDFFVSFSSIASVWGSQGQAHYAAANHFLDTLAHYRHGLGLPALSINWGPWQGSAMLLPEFEKLLAQIGVRPVPPTQAIEALGYLVGSTATQTTVADVDWGKFKDIYTARRQRWLLEEIKVPVGDTKALSQEAAKQSELMQQLQAVPHFERRNLLLAHVRSQALKILALDPTFSVDSSQPLIDLGLDSLMAVELRNALSKSLGHPLPATLLFDYPTIAALTNYLDQEVLAGTEAEHKPPVIASPRVLTKDEPIAIVGMSGRFPGARNIDAFWELLRNGVDAITQVPQGRWNNAAYYDPDPEAPGKTYTRWGGFIEDVDQFDPQFFGISPREAVAMDPQQRLLLETSWEALENAGLSASRLMGSQTGVFVGIGNYDYAQLLSRVADAERADAYTTSGNALSVAAGRLSYVLGLHGPSLAVDTACSSSLVALHLACQSLSSGECDTALAGGVSLMLVPEITVALSRAHMMAADGHCKTFDAAADGYVRGEGCGIVVLKRLSDAVADGDHILALIRGTAVNQDGRSQGLTAPNGLAQEAVIAQALSTAGVEPRDVYYVEAHGTGTALGDPIEVGALAATYGAGRSIDHKLIVGSVKTNIGHLENAAGVAGLIKVVLSMQHELIPSHLNFREPSPYIPWDEIPVTVASSAQPWPAGNGRRLAGLSSFGFSGTNAHVIIEEAPQLEAVPTVLDRPSHLFALSAKSEAALHALAQSYHDDLAHRPHSLADLCYTANSGRSHFSHRLALVAESTSELREKLAAFNEGQQMVGLAQGEVFGADAPKIAFLFTGQGAQYVGMGRQLYDTQPTFRSALDQCAEILQPYLEQPLLAVLYPEDDNSPIDETAYTQPALFALEYAVAQLWLSWGVQPSVVMGHSVGEYVAACIAGVFSLEEGLKLIATRARLMQALSPGGIMVSLFTNQERVAEAIAPYREQVSMAAINGPDNIVISGAAAAVQAVVAQLEQEGVTARALTVSHAFHSPLMDPMLDEFEEVARSISYHTPQMGLISNVTGQLVKGEDVSKAGYWREHVRQPVQFAQAMAILQQQGYEVFVEVGPHPTLLGMGQRTWTDGERPGVWLASLRKGRESWLQILDSLAQLYVHGVEIDWVGFDRDYAPARRRLSLPSYPFQHQRFWFETSGKGVRRTSLGAHLGEDVHPLLGYRLPSALKDVQFETHLTAHTPSFLARRHLHGQTLLPETSYLEVGLAAAAELFATLTPVVENLVVHGSPLLLSTETQTMQVVLTPTGKSNASLQIFGSTPTEDREPAWHLLATGNVKAGFDLVVPGRISIEEIQARSQAVVGATYYARLEQLGLVYDSQFRPLQQVWQAESEILGQLQMLEDEQPYQLHPLLLDVCCQLLAAGNTSLYVPVSFERVQVYDRSVRMVWCLAHVRSVSATGILGDVFVLGESYEPVAQLSGILLRERTADGAQSTVPPLNEWLYEIEWQKQPQAESRAVTRPGNPGHWLILSDTAGIGAALAQELQTQGESCLMVWPCNATPANVTNARELDATNPAEFHALLREMMESSGQPLRGVIHLWGLDAPAPTEVDLPALEDRQISCLGSVLHTIQALATTVAEFKAALTAETPRLWIATRGAQPIGTQTKASLAVAQAPLWGLGKTIALEQPKLWGGLSDLDPAAAVEETAADLFNQIWQFDGEQQVAFRQGQRYVARLVQNSESLAPAQSVHLRPDGAYLITGGLGGLGLVVARWLVEQGARRLILMGRTPLPPRAHWKQFDPGSRQASQIAAIRQLENMGATVHVASIDVADEAQLSDYLTSYQQEGWPPILGVIHAAGLIRDNSLLQLDLSAMQEVLRPKVLGSWLLHQYLKEMPLDFFVMFSSGASLFGSAGQGNYAAANAFLEALAHYRHSQGLPALSINWGAWAEVGMAAQPDIEARRAHRGMSSILPEQGVEMLGRLLWLDHAQLGVMPLTPMQLRQLSPIENPFLSELKAEIPAAEGTSQAATILTQLGQTAAQEWMGLMMAHLGQRISQILMVDAAVIPIDRNMMELGLDSIMIMELIQKLDRDLNLNLYPREIFERPSVSALAKYLLAELARTQGAALARSQSTNVDTESMMPRSNPQALAPSGKRNPAMVFLLSAPRSGSTLLRVMMAGHPCLFSPPELHLLLFKNLSERHIELGHSLLNQGLERALMELMNLDVEQSQALLAEWVAQDVSIQDVYRRLQELASPRLLVDKSPSYAIDLSILERAEAFFENPKYIHLVRHPYAVVDSIVQNRLDILYRSEESDPLKFAEQLWASMNSNILDFLEGIDSERRHLISYEELVTEPERVLRDLCTFLDIPFDAAILTPYTGQRMKDESLVIEDANFFKYKDIDAAKAQSWQKVNLSRRLGGFARRIGAELNYEMPWPLETVSTQAKQAVVIPPPLKPISREGELPLSFAQQRLLFIDLLEPGLPMYHIPLAVRLTGDLNVVALKNSLNEIVQRHEVLRTNFSMIEGQSVQTITDADEMPWSTVDLQDVPQAEQEAAIQRVIGEEVQRPFDLSQDVKIRASLLHLGQADQILLLVMHHIASDGWSIGVFLRELKSIYDAFAAGQPSPLSPLPVQYVDVAHWQRRWLQEDVLHPAVSYWKQKLAGVPVLELPTDRPRPPIQTYRGDRYRLSWSPELTASLKALSQQEGVTLFMTLLSGFQALLQRYTNQDDIAVGTPIAGRGQPETRDLIGFFLNTLVLRTDVSGDPTFRELLKRVRQVALEAYEQQELPFDKLVEELKPARDLSHAPLFQVMFTLNLPLSAPELANLRTTHLVDIPTATSMLDLFLMLRDTPDGLKGWVEYNTDLFDAETIRRMVVQLETLLTAASTNPNQPLSSLPLMPPAEQQQLLIEWNDTAMDYTHDVGLHRLFENQAAQTPDATAVIFQGHQLTYRELNERANQLAHSLQNLGVGTETLIGIHIERSLEMIVALLGVLKAGGAYVPLDPAFPADRLAYMLADSKSTVLLTQENLKDALEVGPDVKIICLDSKWDAINHQPSDNPDSPVQSRNLAYVIYTSGSTGNPKGVQLQHQGVVSFMMSMRQEPGLTAQDVFLSVTTISFDISVLEIFLPLTTGAALVLVSRETAADGAQLLVELERTGATVMQATPSTWRLLIEAGWSGTRGLKILCGGESWSRDLANQLLERCDSLWNMYGPTETTIWSTTMQVLPGEEAISIGRPIGNTECYILDAHLNPLPVGVPGELYIGGHGLARGYLNRPELTNEKFIPHPFSNKPDARLYKTGDVARYLPNANIEILGRMDNQVKVRGFRIELGEIESLLNQHSVVKNSVVTVREEVPGDKRLVAYVISEQEQLPVSELRRFLNSALPDYMVPSHFVRLDNFPLTPNGKVDRRALPAPDGARPELETNYVAPQDETEQTIATLWQEALKVETIGVHDNFFDLGGHSLLLAQVHSKLQRQLDVEIPIIKLFQYPTIHALVGYLNQQQEQGSAQQQVRQRADRQKAALARQRQLAIKAKRSSHE